MGTATEVFVRETLHGLLFLEEFVFPTSRFATPRDGEIEFADAVVVLGETLLVCQIKERDPASVGDANVERKWFDKAVLKKATKQVRDTLSYLHDFDEIPVANLLGRVANLAASAYKDVIKLVLYRSSAALPADCRAVRYHVSSTVGFIHVMDVADYLELLRTLRVPTEAVHYFLYRERLLANFEEGCGCLPEAAIAGHFIGGNQDELPTMNSLRFLHALKQDEEEWDIAPILRSLRTNLGAPGSGDDYYPILLEFAKLRRAYWREAHVRMRLSFEAASSGEWRQAFRFRVGDVGFVFVPVHPELVASPEWSEGASLRFVSSLMEAHMYDQRITRCVGYQVAYEGNGSFLVTWAYSDHPWKPNSEIEAVLARNFPFRPLQEAQVYGFKFDDDAAM